MSRVECPRGFRERTGPGRSRVWVRDELALAVEGHDWLPLRGVPAAALDPRPLSGRGGAFRIGWPGMDGDFVYRRALRGGLVAKVNRDRFFFDRVPRPFAEVALSEELRARGVDTPELVLAVVRRGRSGAYRGAVVSRWVEGGCDLADTLAALARDGEPPDGPRVCAIWRAVGAAIGRLHAAGVLHADLNARNLLLVKGPAAASAPRVFVLDLDRSRRVPSLSASERASNWARLERSLAKFPDAARVTGSGARAARDEAYHEALAAPSERAS